MKLFFTLCASLCFVLCFLSGILVGDGTLTILQGIMLFAIGVTGGMVSVYALEDAIAAGDVNLG